MCLIAQFQDSIIVVPKSCGRQPHQLSRPPGPPRRPSTLHPQVSSIGPRPGPWSRCRQGAHSLLSLLRMPSDAHQPPEGSGASTGFPYAASKDSLDSPVWDAHVIDVPNTGIPLPTSVDKEPFDLARLGCFDRSTSMSGDEEHDWSASAVLVQRREVLEQLAVLEDLLLEGFRRLANVPGRHPLTRTNSKDVDPSAWGERRCRTLPEMLGSLPVL